MGAPSAEALCLKCPLPECREIDPACLMRPLFDVARDRKKAHQQRPEVKAKTREYQRKYQQSIQQGRTP